MSDFKFLSIDTWWKAVLALGILSWKAMKHNPISIVLILIGIGLIGLFGYLIVKGLI